VEKGEGGDVDHRKNTKKKGERIPSRENVLLGLSKRLRLRKDRGKGEESEQASPKNNVRHKKKVDFQLVKSTRSPRNDGLRKSSERKERDASCHVQRGEKKETCSPTVLFGVGKITFQQNSRERPDPHLRKEKKEEQSNLMEKERSGKEKLAVLDSSGKRLQSDLESANLLKGRPGNLSGGGRGREALLQRESVSPIH